MVTRWKDNPALWEEMFKTNHTSSIGEMGYGGIKSVEIAVREDGLPELRDLKGRIEAFWEGFSQEHPGSRNSPVYILKGTEDTIVKGDKLVLSVDMSDYATVRYKNSRVQKEDETLTQEQRDFLDNRFHTLGVAGYVFSGDTYLLGVRADVGDREDLMENIPQGLVDPKLDGIPSNAVYNAFDRLLRKETGLDLGTDVKQKRITHINDGPKYGDFTIIWGAEVDPENSSKAKSPEGRHSGVYWVGKRELAGMVYTDRKTGLNPGTVALFEKVLPK
jgi:hypothetical protein